MRFGKSDDRQMICSDHLKKIQSGKEVAAFRCRDDDQITRVYTLYQLLCIGLDEKRERFNGFGDQKKRDGPPDDERMVT